LEYDLERLPPEKQVKNSIVILLGVLGVLGVSACTTTQEIRRPNGEVEYLIACGASLGWNICYDRANEVCPTGYTTISEQGGFNRKELRIACPGATKGK
jgi:hypothetical protein